MNHRSRVLRRVAALSIATVAFAACSSSSKSSTPGGGGAGSSTASSSSASSSSASSSSSGSSASGTSTTAGGSPLQQAMDATTQAEKGTNRPVDPTPRPAVKGKHIVVISAGQAADSSKIPVQGAADAAKAIGWQVDIYDAALNPAKYPGLVRQAIAAGVDGIVLDSIDCQTVKQPLEEAKAKGIAITAIYAFDCNDPHAGGESTGLYSALVNFGPKAAANPGKFSESYGMDQANYIIAASQNKAKIIALQDTEFTVLYYTYTGFKSQIDASGGSQVVDTLNFTVADLLSGRLTAKVQAELLRFPEANWIKSPFTAATQISIIPGLGAKAGTINVMGGEGFPAELDFIRQGKVTAANVISSDWVGWGSVDAMNSVFSKQPTVDSGIGWTIVDKTHNLPAAGPFVPEIDYKSAYKKAWGVG